MIHRTSTVQASTVMVWFCTVCNNQNRIVEELGSEILESPFAHVLRLPSIKTVALVSPLKALERKWCTFEFSIAVAQGLNILMVTHNGVIQAGQVAPIVLKGLA